jgi:hypothetical protein
LRKKEKRIKNPAAAKSSIAAKVSKPRASSPPIPEGVAKIFSKILEELIIVLKFPDFVFLTSLDSFSHKKIEFWKQVQLILQMIVFEIRKSKINEVKI